MKKARIIHPILIALFPVLFLYSQNMDGFPLRVILVPTIILIVFAAVAWSLMARVLKGAERAALLISFFMLLFFSYGHAYHATWHYFSIEPFTCGPKKVLVPVLSLLFVVGAFFIIRTKRSLIMLTRLVNFSSAVLVIFPLFSIVTHSLAAIASPEFPGAEPLPLIRAELSSPASHPDIYYIILDGYGREDILQELYDYDNRTFLDQLATKGFHVIADAQANYCQTTLSLASSLNMRYLDPTNDRLDPDSDNRSLTEQMVLQSEVHRLLRTMGYTSVAFSTGYRSTEIVTADVYFEMGTNLWFLDEFQNGLLNTTPIPAIMNRARRLPFLGKGIGQAQSDSHRDRILSVFRHLRSMRSDSRPQFVFAHVITPHPPFLFGRDGEHLYPEGVFTHADGSHLIGPFLASTEEYVRKYVNQLTYINQLALAAVDSILARSVRPPVILLQADHGPGSQLDWDNIDSTNVRERLSILNAYYLPDSGDTLLYDGITPVNTFRLIFNHYFGSDYEFLEDRSYFSTWPRPFDFYDVTDELKAPAAMTAHPTGKNY